jgi:hypothetical protein
VSRRDPGQSRRLAGTQADLLTRGDDLDAPAGVEHHLRKVFHKLYVSNCRELRAALANDQGLVG